MKKLERLIITVDSVHKEQQILVGSTKNGERMIIKGTFKDLYPKDTILLFGTMEKNKKYGRYYQSSYYIEKKTENWLMKRLKFEYKIKDKKIMQYLLNPLKYIEMKQCLIESKRIQNLMVLLQKKGIKMEWISKIERDFLWRYGLLLKDVYQLLKYEMVKIMWLDEWIQKGIVEGNKVTKAYYLAQQLLKKAYAQGHFYLPLPVIEAYLSKSDLSIKNIKNFDMFQREKGRMYLKEFYKMEVSIVDHIEKRVGTNPTRKFTKESIVEWETDNQFTLATNQKEAVLMALNHSFCVVTGGPGVGKTTTCKCITDILGEQYRIKLVAPTGRAAKRAQESTGLDASTIHSLLEYNGVRFNRNAERLIETDVLVIDESSMIDTPLLLALLDATPIETIIIFVGDVDQLPSVGAGQALKDLIKSNMIPVTRLTEIFRQAAGSPIIQCAYSVNEGKMPDLTSHDFLEYHEYHEELFVLKKTLSIAKKLYQEHSVFDVQVLIPMYDGTVGINEVNRRIQEFLHPNVPSVAVGDFEIRLGDKVIQTKNDKIKKIHNGDVGVVTSVEINLIKVKFQGHEQEITYQTHEFRHLRLAYAVTVHRAQGSEYPFVVIPLVNGYRHMLQKNLFYTGITRAKKKLSIVFQMEAMKRAVDMKSVPVRYTGLAERLHDRIS